MHIKHLQKASDLLDQLLAIDQEIIYIEKLANICADGDVNVKLSLSVKSTKPTNEVNHDIFDEYGFIKPEYLNPDKPKGPDSTHAGDALRYTLAGPFKDLFEQIATARNNMMREAVPNFAKGCAVPEEVLRTQGAITREISDVNTLQILGWIIGEKNTTRQRILQDLKDCGIKI